MDNTNEQSYAQSLVTLHLAGLSNSKLLVAFATATECLECAANTEPNSEWHEACFAACVVYAQEMSKRNLMAD